MKIICNIARHDESADVKNSLANGDILSEIYAEDLLPCLELFDKIRIYNDTLASLNKEMPDIKKATTGRKRKLDDLNRLACFSLVEIINTIKDLQNGYLRVDNAGAYLLLRQIFAIRRLKATVYPFDAIAGVWDPDQGDNAQLLYLRTFPAYQIVDLPKLTPGEQYPIFYAVQDYKVVELSKIEQKYLKFSEVFGGEAQTLDTILNDIRAWDALLHPIELKTLDDLEDHLFNKIKYLEIRSSYAKSFLKSFGASTLFDALRKSPHMPCRLYHEHGYWYDCFEEVEKHYIKKCLLMMTEK